MLGGILYISLSHSVIRTQPLTTPSIAKALANMRMRIRERLMYYGRINRPYSTFMFKKPSSIVMSAAVGGLVCGAATRLRVRIQGGEISR